MSLFLFHSISSFILPGYTRPRCDVDALRQYYYLATFIYGGVKVRDVGRTVDVIRATLWLRSISGDNWYLWRRLKFFYLSFFLTVCYYQVTYEFQSESTLYSLPECQGTPFSKQASYPKFKWQQQDSNPQPLSS